VFATEGEVGVIFFSPGNHVEKRGHGRVYVGRAEEGSGVGTEDRSHSPWESRRKEKKRTHEKEVDEKEPASVKKSLWTLSSLNRPGVSLGEGGKSVYRGV